MRDLAGHDEDRAEARAPLTQPWRALLLIAVAVAIVGVFPVLAPLIAWPLLLGLPAWFLVARVAPSITPAGRLGVAIVAGIELTTHATYLVAVVTGFGSAQTLAVVALAAAATWLLATRELPWLEPPPKLSVAATTAALRAQRATFLLAGAAVTIVGGVLQLSAWHRTDGGWVSGGWNWSDFLVHVSIAQSVKDGNFPPQVPYFSGSSLANYHWFGDFHAAILARVAQADVIPVLIICNAVLAGALALCVCELARVLTGNNRVAVLAGVLVLFGGGLGYMRLFMDLHYGGSLSDLTSTTPYDNNFGTGWPYFHIASVFGTALLDQRATTYGLPIAVAAVLLAVTSWRRNPAGVLLAGILAGLECPFMFFFFPAIYLILIIVLVARRAWRDPDHWMHAFLLFLPGVYGAAFLLHPVLSQHTQGNARLVAGWPDAPFSDGIPAVVFFYVTNLGVPFVLALVALVWRRTPHRLLLGAWLAALFVLPNIVVTSSVTFDANKFFQLMWIPAAILAAWLIRGWPRPAIAGVLALSVVSPLLIAVWHVRDTRVALSLDQESAARWIEDNTPQLSVFVTDAFINSSVDLAGRLRLSSYDPYITNMGYDPTARDAEVHDIYCDGAASAHALMVREGASYVLSTGGILDCGTGVTPTDFDTSPAFEVVYRAGAVTVWHLRGA
jgi:hypothetical protein